MQQCQVAHSMLLCVVESNRRYLAHSCLSRIQFDPQTRSLELSMSWREVYWRPAQFIAEIYIRTTLDQEP
jgi:hypothetical protein